MKMKWVCVSMCVLSLLMGGGCEDDDDDSDDSPADVTSTNDNAGLNAPGGSDTETELLGVWKGTAGTSQGDVTVELTEYFNNALPVSGMKSGTLTWDNGDKRQIVDAMYEPPELVFYIYPLDVSGTSDRGDEVWNLVYDGASLSGKGTKTDGSKYDVFLTRP